MELFNKLSAEQRRELIKKAGDKRLTLSFYKYHKILNPQLFRDHLFVVWNELDVLGRIYIANEGINAQLSVPSKNLDNLSGSLRISGFNLSKVSCLLHHLAKKTACTKNEKSDSI
mgnify:CR=1 FL=1